MPANEATPSRSRSFSAHLAGWLSPAGAPERRVVSRAGAAVMAVPGRYSVSYLLLGPEAVVVVDVGSAADPAAIFAALDELGRPTAQVRTVVPTHLHMDHIMGVDALALRLGVPVTLGTVAHAVVTAGRPSRFPRPLHLLRAIPTYFLQGAPLVPVVDLRRGLDFGFPWSKNRFRAPLAAFAADPEPLPGLPGWRVLDTPGHADDAICLYHAAAGFLVAGDTIRNFLGGEWNPLLCDAAAYADTRRRLAELPVRTIFPGHGPLIEGEAAMHALRTLPAWMP